MTKREMMKIVCSQLAIDYNCKPEDFNKDGVIFTIAEKQEGRREMPFITRRLEIITIGKSAIVNVSKNMMSFAKRKFEVCWSWVWLQLYFCSMAVVERLR